MVKELVKYVTSQSPEEQKWIGLKNNISAKRKVIVVLTMYTKPENGVRATYNIGKSTLKFADIGKAIKVVFDNKKVLWSVQNVNNQASFRV